MEEERRAKINDELQQVKATSTTVEENIKQLLTTWDDVKIKIEKFLQVVEVCCFCYCGQCMLYIPNSNRPQS